MNNKDVVGSKSIEKKIRQYQLWKDHTGHFYNYVSSMAFTWPIISVHHLNTKIDPKTKDCSISICLAACSDENSFLQVSNVSALSQKKIELALSDTNEVSQPDPVFEQHSQYRLGETIYRSARENNNFASYLDSGNISICSINGVNITENVLISNNTKGFGLVLKGNKVFCSSSEGTINVWDIIKNEIVYTEECKVACDALCSSSKDGCFISGDDRGSLRFHDIRVKTAASLLKTVKSITSLCYGKNDSLIYLGNDIGDIMCYDTRKEKFFRQLSFHDSSINGLEYNEKYRTLVSYSNDSKVALWKTNSSVTKPWFVHSGHSEAINHVAFAENDMLTCLSTDEDNLLQIWSPV